MMKNKKSLFTKKDTHVAYIFYSFYIETLKFDRSTHVDDVCNRFVKDYIETFNISFHDEYKNNFYYTLKELGLNPICTLDYTITTPYDKNYEEMIEAMSIYEGKYFFNNDGKQYIYANDSISVNSIIKMKVKVKLSTSDHNLLKIKNPTLYERLKFNITHDDSDRLMS